MTEITDEEHKYVVLKLLDDEEDLNMWEEYRVWSTSPYGPSANELGSTLGTGRFICFLSGDEYQRVHYLTVEKTVTYKFEEKDDDQA